jgi:DNA primase
VHVQNIDNFAFVHETYQTLYLLAASYFETHSEYLASEFVDYVKDDRLQQLLVEVELIQTDESANIDAVNDYIRIIMQKTPIEEQIKSKKMQLHEASHLKNQELEQQLTIELIDLLRKQQQL